MRLGMDKSMVLYAEADLRRRDTEQLVADGVEHAREFRPHGFGVESNQFQQLLCPDFLRVAKQQGVALPLVPVDNMVNKQVRIRRVGPYLAQRRMRFKARSPGTLLLVQQLKDFPAGDHDDGPDALEVALRLLTELWNGRNKRADGLTRIIV